MSNDKICYSVILMSRKRPLRLKECIESVFNMACFPDNVEILVRVDQDDKLTLDFCKDDSIFKNKTIRVFSGPKIGLLMGRIMLKRLCENTRGDFIVPIADDCFMVNEWDKILLPYKGKVAVLGNGPRIAITRLAYEKYDFIKDFGGENTLKLDYKLYRFAMKNKIFIEIPKLFGHTEIEDQTKLDNEWQLQNLELLRIPDTEIVLQ